MSDNMNSLSLNEQATNYETYRHIDEVIKLLLTMQFELSKRIVTHDRSKLCAPEVNVFTEYTPKLKGTTYGTPEYFEMLKAMKPALDSHYAENRHHPEHYPNGIEGMNLIDILEMLCDWRASSQRHADGDIYRSIEINTERFSLSPQLVQIFRNTVPLLTSVYGARTQKHLNEYWNCHQCGTGGLEANFCQMCGAQKPL